jgi:hypothetical protein
MWSQSRTRPARRGVGAAAALLISLTGLGTMLAGCSDIYFDRRETVALGADDHIGTNRVAQMIDTWASATSHSTARRCSRRLNAIGPTK